MAKLTKTALNVQFVFIRSCLQYLIVLQQEPLRYQMNQFKNLLSHLGVRFAENHQLRQKSKQQTRLCAVDHFHCCPLVQKYLWLRSLKWSGLHAMDHLHVLFTDPQLSIKSMPHFKPSGAEQSICELAHLLRWHFIPNSKQTKDSQKRQQLVLNFILAF